MRLGDHDCGRSHNVLVVTFHFPPDAAVGALRWQKFVKYLPTFGWSPLVLTVQDRYYEMVDRARLADTVSARVWRTAILPNPRVGLRRVKSALLWMAPRNGHLSNRSQSPFTQAWSPPTSQEGAMALVRRTLFSLCWVPDDHLGWLPVGVLRGLRICRREAVGAIVTSGPPHTCHLIGLWLKRLTGLRWIADFRDPWTADSWKPDFVRTRLSDRLDAAMERAVVRSADRVVLVTDQLRAQFEREYEDLPRAKFITIPNGFDPADFHKSPGNCYAKPFTLVHAGSIYGRRSANTLLTAVSQLIREGRIPASEIRIVFVGHRPEFSELVGALGLSRIVECVGVVPYPDAIRWMQAADLLVLLSQEQPDQIPAKAFEYLAAGPPILAVTDDGATADFVREVGGFVVRDTPETIKLAIDRMYRSYRTRTLNGSRGEPWTRDEARRYDRRNLTQQLVSVLEDVA